MFVNSLNHVNLIINWNSVLGMMSWYCHIIGYMITSFLEMTRTAESYFLYELYSNIIPGCYFGFQGSIALCFSYTLLYSFMYISCLLWIEEDVSSGCYSTRTHCLFVVNSGGVFNNLLFQDNFVLWPWRSHSWRQNSVPFFLLSRKFNPKFFDWKAPLN